MLPALILGLLTSACTGDSAGDYETLSSPEFSDARTSVGVVDNDLQEAIEDIAHTVALALAEPAARSSMLSAMRESLFNEHKILLGPFLDSEPGRAMVSAARARGGASSENLRKHMADFPGGLDFYLVSGSQRRSWAGNDRVLVAGVADLDARQARAFDPAGNGHVIDQLDVPGVDALVVIHPAEPKTVMRGRTSRGSGPIESASDIEAVGGTSSAICPLPCEPGDPPPGGGGGSGGGASTRVTSILPDFDDGIFGGNVELYFVTSDVNNSSNSYESAVFEAEPYINNFALNVKVFDDAASQFLHLRAVLWESDGFLSGDDRKGEPWPTDIKGSGAFASFDPFEQIFWAEYHVVANGA